MSGRSATTVLPFPSFFATRNAAATAAPDDIPVRIPSVAANFLAVSIANSLVISSKSSITSLSIILGKNPAEIPWIRCFPFCPFEINGASSGSTPII